MGKGLWIAIIVIILIVAGFFIFKGPSEGQATDTSGSGAAASANAVDTTPEATALTGAADQVDTSDFSDTALNDLG